MATTQTTPSIPIQEGQDWPRALIKARIEMEGWSLSRLSIHHGFTRTAISQAIRKPCSPTMERIVGDVLKVKPDEIWPTRYLNGERVPNRHLAKSQHTTPKRNQAKGDLS
ncbi:MAG: helix-turn-helix domain-containing protein [Magnetococcales bacterium]|nr:helix-turn-helix domain-containing protein [Magnetococcales bacterium]MBF0114713.1 helix-turn-helix domain-containing protein [Magnetococcales bacterium]